MPDFNVKENFPIASVIQAAQQNAQRQMEAQQSGQKQLLEGLQSIGQIGQSLYDTRKRVAQSLALGRQFDISDDVAKTMAPEDILKVGAIKKGNIDMNMLLNLLHPGSGGTGLQVPGTSTPSPQIPTPAPTPAPTSNASTALVPDNGASPQVTTSPINPNPLTPPTTGSMPVPIAAPPATAKAINPATFKALMELSPKPVVSTQDALDQGSVPARAIIRDEKGGPKDIMDPNYQGKLEKQYADMRMKALSNRSGGLGLQDSKVNQAIDLRKLVNKYYDPKSGEFNIPPSQHAELALGLARLVSPNGQVGIDLLHELRQGTAREAISKALIYAGADPSQVGGPTQNVAKMFIDSVDRQGETAEQLRDQYMSYISDNAPVDLEPSRKAHHDQGKLNSFNNFLSQSPDRQAQSSGGIPEIGQTFNGGKVLSVKRVK